MLCFVSSWPELTRRCCHNHRWQHNLSSPADPGAGRGPAKIISSINPGADNEDDNHCWPELAPEPEQVITPAGPPPLSPAPGHRTLLSTQTIIGISVQLMSRRAQEAIFLLFTCHLPFVILMIHSCMKHLLFMICILYLKFSIFLAYNVHGSGPTRSDIYKGNISEEHQII